MVRTSRLGNRRSSLGKEANPAWYPPPSIRAERPELPAMVPPGPQNPLGAFAVHLGWKNYRIHGTNKPDGVGRNVSHGCIRVRNRVIERLAAILPLGTPVRISARTQTSSRTRNNGVSRS